MFGIYLPAVKTRRGCNGKVLETECGSVRVSTWIQSSHRQSDSNKLALSCPVGLAKQLHPIHGRKHSSINRFASFTCAAAALVRFYTKSFCISFHVKLLCFIKGL